MPIQVTCPGCSKSFRVPDSAAGRSGKCLQCGSRIRIPHQESQTESAGFLDDLDDAIREGEKLAKEQRARVRNELRVSEADANLAKRMQAAEETRAAKQKSPTARRIHCDNCGRSYEIELSGTEQEDSCDHCGRLLFIPTLKAYDYDAKERSKNRLWIVLMLILGIVGGGFHLYNHFAYLDTPEGMAYQKARSVADLDVAIVSGSTPLKVRYTRPKCVGRRREESLYLFHYDVYYEGRTDLQRCTKYVVIQCQNEDTKVVETTVGIAPSGW